MINPTNPHIPPLYTLIKTQRTHIHTAIDKYGLTSIANTHPQETYRFLLIIHLMLSSQTKDIITHETLSILISKNLLTCAKLAKLEVIDIKKIIYKVGFANTKSKYILKFCHDYINKQMPTTYEQLIQIKGVGNKTAYLYLQYATGEVIGIGVDVHVFRVCNRLGLNVKTADECDKKLQEIFCKNEWGSINKTLVGFGQAICVAKKPKCKECCVREMCPSSRFGLKSNW